jgi:hypothetical protein
MYERKFPSSIYVLLVMRHLHLSPPCRSPSFPSTSQVDLIYLLGAPFYIPIYLKNFQEVWVVVAFLIAWNKNNLSMVGIV